MKVTKGSVCRLAVEGKLRNRRATVVHIGTDKATARPYAVVATKIGNHRARVVLEALQDCEPPSAAQNGQNERHDRQGVPSMDYLIVWSDPQWGIRTKAVADLVAANRYAERIRKDGTKVVIVNLAAMLEAKGT